MEKHIKAAGPATVDGGMVKGYAATFVREPDSYGDVIAKGAFEESVARWDRLAAEGKRIPLLYGHNMDDPFHNIGSVVSAKEDEYGLLIEAEFDPDNETAQYARKLVQEGRLYQFSFAYSVLDEAEVELDDGRKANELRKLDLYEVSLVQIPANQTAVVTEVKAAETIEVSGPAGPEDADATDGDAKGASEAQAEFVEAYKQALLTYFKE